MRRVFKHSLHPPCYLGFSWLLFLAFIVENSFESQDSWSQHYSLVMTNNTHSCWIKVLQLLAPGINVYGPASPFLSWFWMIMLMAPWYLNHIFHLPQSVLIHQHMTMICQSFLWEYWGVWYYIVDHHIFWDVWLFSQN